ncbi:MAG: alpha-amylase family glycosyl hydrolase [Bacteroidetes bacterium]|jgi:glycosidase|nr:alpha-amylase family glycosyl hydrolase [Bacteroidota bacterium]
MKTHVLVSLTALFLSGCAGKPAPISTLTGPWTFRVDSMKVGVAEGWMNDPNDWPTAVHVPGAWDTLPGLALYDGPGWYRTSFVPPDLAEPWSLYFEGVDDDATVWLNGIELGAHVGYADPFVFDTRTAARDGDNLLVVRIVDHAGPGGLYKPVHIIRTKDREGFLRSPLAQKQARRSEPWVTTSVIYEVYVRSFSPEGTFKGLEARLGELKDLGVTVLWLMPIHPIGELNRKGTLGSPYAIRDFYGVNPEFGTGDDFRSLVKAAHALEMRVIIDLVANHTAWDNQMLVEHPDWYTQNDEGGIVAPNPDWTDVADLNYDRHELRKYMIAMMRHWVQEYDIDGYRCDVAELVPTEFWETARRELEKVKPVMMLSEGTLPEHHVRAFDLTYSWNVYDMLGPIFAGEVPANRLLESIERESYRFPKGSLRMRFNTNHDKNAWDLPATTKFGPDGALMTQALAFMLPGVPLIFNGEEVGNTKRLDLFEKVGIDWSASGPARAFMTSLGRMRRDNPWLATGALHPLKHDGPRGVLAFGRRSDDGEQTLLGVYNFTSDPVTVGLEPDPLLEGSFVSVVGGSGTADPDQITLPARSAAILKRQP